MPHMPCASSFHYEGYNFDSNPEAEFLDWTLGLLQAQPHQIEGLWFTGGLTDAGKTDLRAEYLGDDGRWHTYTPDFVLRRADGKHLVVEVKSDKLSPDIMPTWPAMPPARPRKPWKAARPWP
jgi:type III restriction enzyme